MIQSAFGFIVASTIPIPTVQLCLERAGTWFLRSGIQDLQGGVARYYYSDRRQNAAVSNEITGYAVSAYLYLYEALKQREYLTAAQRAGDFLCESAWRADLEAMPFEHRPEQAEPTDTYFFDCGIIARGLTGLYRATGELRYLERAEEIGRSMARDFGGAQSGRYHPIVELPSKQPRMYGTRWSQRPGCYQLKSALGWQELFEATGQPEYGSYYRTALRAALADFGRFLPGHQNPDEVMNRLHPATYFLEGLLPCADEPAVAAALAEGIRQTAYWLRQIAPRFVRVDVYAQLLRARLFAAAFDAVPFDEAAAEEEAAAMAEFQAASADPRIHGGFVFGRRGGEMLPFVNPVSTAFCLQALHQYAQWQAGEFEPDWRTLI